MSGPCKGIDRAERMRRWSDQKGGKTAAPDGFDRSAPDTLASQTDAWLLWLEQRAYSPRTREGRRWALRVFLGWAQARGLARPQEVTKPILESYQRWLWEQTREDGRPLSVSTQIGRLLGVQRFFAWLCRENHLPSNPAADLTLPRKPPAGLPRGLSAEQMAAILAVPNLGDPLGVRDRTMLETLYATGLRRRELTQLELGDLDRARGTLAVRKGKGGKDRMVPLGEHALYWIERYLRESRPRLETGPREQAVFLTGYGERFSTAGLGNIVRAVLRRAGVRPERAGCCHLFRHTCATHMLEGGADIRYIQQLLGHAKLETTQIYTAVTIDQLREVHARCHPHGRREPIPATP